MRKFNLFLGVAVMATMLFTACGGNTPTVDEGVVINGVKWATRNVDSFGKFAEKPESSGMFYQWNRPTAWAATGSVTGWDNEFISDKTWETTNDPCPAGWRVPTKAELEGLGTGTWTIQNGVNGRQFGTKPNQIFLPAAGHRSFNDGKLNRVGENGGYWSSTEQGSYDIDAYCLGFGSSAFGFSAYDKRFGMSVRCVAK